MLEKQGKPYKASGCKKAGIFFISVIIVLVGGTNVGAGELVVSLEDTIQISAPRVSVEEVITAIGQKMADDWDRVDEHEYTGLLTSISRATPGVNGGDYTLLESASRFRHSKIDGKSKVRLWLRKRSYKNFKLVSDEIDDKVERGWEQSGRVLVEALPFMPGSGNRYNYEVLDRKLIGNSLVYKIWFTPRSQFEALPSGTVWVDYSNWVIRKVDASMTGAVPMPFFVKDVPFYRMTKAQVGDYWVDAETHTMARLRVVPLVPVPNNVDVRFVTVDHVINGVPGERLTVVDPGEFWMSPDEAERELRVYWDDLDRVFNKEVSTQFRCDDPMACGDMELLAEVGSLELDKMERGAGWETTFHAVKEPRYNRVQGPVLQVGVGLGWSGGRKAIGSADVGYGLASQRPVWSVGGVIPLNSGELVKNNNCGIQYTGVSLGFNVSQEVVSFAGDQRLTSYERSLSALVYGSDPNHYYEEKSVGFDLNWCAHHRLNFVLEGRFSRQRSMGVIADWNLFGEPLGPEGNLEISNQNVRVLGAGFRWSNGPWLVEGGWAVHHLSDSDFLRKTAVGPTSEDLHKLSISGKWDYLDTAGNRWILEGSYFALDEMAPIQMQVWYGDWGSLRGHPAAVLEGETGQNISFDWRMGFDLWEALKVPLVRGWGLQPHVFADYAVASAKGALRMEEGAQGTKWDIGFGFGKLVNTDNDGKPTYLRVQAAVPVGDGSEGMPWRILVGLGN